jgi:hypothetical protein
MNRVLVAGGTGGAGGFLASPDSAPLTGAAIPIG